MTNNSTASEMLTRPVGRRGQFPEKDYVYVVEFGDQLVKVGRSIYPHTRAKNLSTGSGRKLGRIWVSRPMHSACKMEGRVHAALGARRGLGEWFACSFDEAVSIAEREFSEGELWSEEGAARRAEAAGAALQPIKDLIMAGMKEQSDKASESCKKAFLEKMWERALKNCETYLQQKELAEAAYWRAVSEDIDDFDPCEAAMAEAKDIAMISAYSNESYLSATRMEHVMLGVTMESCMLFTQDVNKIPAMLEELEGIIRKRPAEAEATSASGEDFA